MVAHLGRQLLNLLLTMWHGKFGFMMVRNLFASGVGQCAGVGGGWVKRGQVVADSRDSFRGLG